MGQFDIIDKNVWMCCVETQKNIDLNILLFSVLGNQISRM